VGNTFGARLGRFCHKAEACSRKEPLQGANEEPAGEEKTTLVDDWKGCIWRGSAEQKINHR
jgi:hypothetical protein